MSVPYQRISDANVEDIIFYDPSAERRASQMQVDWDTYFKVGSQEITTSKYLDFDTKDT